MVKELSSVRGGFSWMAITQGGLFILQLAVSILMARLLGPYDMGIFAIALSIVGLLSILRSHGLGAYLIKATKLHVGVLTTVFTVNAIVAVLTSLSVVGLSAVGESLLQEKGVRNLLLVLSVVPIIGIFDFIPATLIERRGDFRTVAVINFLRYTIANLSTLGLAYCGLGYLSLGYGNVVGNFVALVLNNLAGRSFIHIRIGLEDWRSVAKYGAQMFTISAVASLQARIADILLAKLLGLAAFGIYSRSGSLTSVLSDNCRLIILRVMFTDFAEQRRRGKSLRGTYLRLMESLTAVFWPAFLGMATISGPLVMTLFGKGWLDAISPLSILAISSAGFVLIMVAQDLFIVCDRTHVLTRLELIRAPVSLALFGLGSWFSLEAAASMKVVEALCVFLLYRRHIERMTDTTWKDFVPIYVRSLILSIIAVSPSFIAMCFCSWSPELPFYIIIITVVAGVLLWVGGLRLFGHPLNDELIRLLRYGNGLFRGKRRASSDT